MNAKQFEEALELLGVNISASQLEQFQRFETAMYEANEVMNLTRVAREDCWLRHFTDSLLFQDLIPSGAAVLDIGTGPGFPAWPLACARPDLAVTALDSNGKMLGFLNTQRQPNLTVVNARAEESMSVEEFDFVTGRAVAPLPAQLEISARFAKIGGLVVPMRTASDAELAGAVDLRPLGLTLVRTEERELPGTEVRRLFPVYRKTHATLAGYPRRWAELKKKPL